MLRLGLPPFAPDQSAHKACFMPICFPIVVTLPHDNENRDYFLTQLRI